jgi:hypothetical protein
MFLAASDPQLPAERVSMSFGRKSLDASGASSYGTATRLQ